MTPTRRPSSATVLHLSTAHSVDDNRIRLKEAQTIRSEGYSVTVAALAPAAASIEDDITEVLLPQYQSRLKRVVFGGIKAFRTAMSERPTLVHLHDPELLLLAPLFRLLGIRTVYDVHEDYPKLLLGRQWLGNRRARALSALVARVEPALARLCDGVVVVDARFLARFGNTRAAVCPNYVVSAELRGAASPHEHDNHFVYVGAISETRGAVAATRAINLLNGPARLTLAGRVESEELRHAIRRADTRDRVSLPGPITRDQIRELFSDATAGIALLTPTAAYQNAIGTKTYEYMAAGLPMILSSTRAHRGLAETYSCCLVAPHDDPAAIAAHMQALTTMPEYRRELAESARQAHQELPCWEDCADELVNLYLGILGQP